MPADIFLLSGDAIVNESMLTGESVPVSKVPVKDEDISRWKESDDVIGDSSKSFLYSGTRVVRIRGVLTPDGSPGKPALGLVVRTGKIPILFVARLSFLITTLNHRFHYDERSLGSLYALP